MANKNPPFRMTWKAVTMPEYPLIPVAVERRLVLNLLGFRLRGGAWVRDQLCLDEELIDRMDPETWEASVPSLATAR